jgi:hypothetical protein
MPIGPRGDKRFADVIGAARGEAQVTRRLNDGCRTIPSRDCFPIDNARAGAQAGQSINDQREAASQVIAGAAVELHPVTVLASDDAEAVVLDFMYVIHA